MSRVPQAAMPLALALALVLAPTVLLLVPLWSRRRMPALLLRLLPPLQGQDLAVLRPGEVFTRLRP